MEKIFEVKTIITKELIYEHAKKINEIGRKKSYISFLLSLTILTLITFFLFFKKYYLVAMVLLSLIMLCIFIFYNGYIFIANKNIRHFKDFYERLPQITYVFSEENLTEITFKSSFKFDYNQIINIVETKKLYILITNKAGLILEKDGFIIGDIDKFKLFINEKCKIRNNRNKKVEESNDNWHYCQNCGTKISMNDNYCRSCGVKNITINIKDKNDIDVVAVQCAVCGEYNPLNISYCEKCGQYLFSTISKSKQITKKEYNEYQKNKPFIMRKNKNSIIIYIILLAFIIGFFTSSSLGKFTWAFFLGIFGCINIIIPLRFLGVFKRKVGIILLIIGFVIMIIVSGDVANKNNINNSYELSTENIETTTSH